MTGDWIQAALRHCFRTAARRKKFDQGPSRIRALCANRDTSRKYRHSLHLGWQWPDVIGKHLALADQFVKGGPCQNEDVYGFPSPHAARDGITSDSG
jgi:hypothetical protein